MITTYDVDASFTARVWSLHVRGLPGTASAVELDDVDRIARKFIAMHTHVPAADVHLLLHFCHPAREESPGDDDRSALRTGPVPAHGTTSYLTRRRGRTGRAVERPLVGPSEVPALRAEGVDRPDAAREHSSPAYRVYFSDGPDAPPLGGRPGSGSRLVDADDVHEALTWADEHSAGADSYTLFVEAERGDQDGGTPELLRLTGDDRPVTTAGPSGR